MRTVHVLLLVAALCVVVAGCCRQVVETVTEGDEAHPEGGELTVAVACGVAGPYGQIKELFEKAHPHAVMHQEVGNIVVMADKLRDGKTQADVFMAIGSTALGKLNEEGLLLEDPTDFAEDLLVVLVPEGNPAGIESFQDLATDEVKSLAIAGSKSTPGEFAEMALQRAGLWEQVQDKLVRPEQPAMLKGYVATGKADAAVMLLTCATKEADMGEEPAEGVPGTEIAFKIPHEHYDRLACQIGIMKDAKSRELAMQFVDFVRSEACQDILTKWDFLPCAEADMGSR